jgi:CheY-like chemotaxis protein
VIRVCDNGIGISPSLLPRVFELFTQGDSAGSRGTSGLGIGLAMVRLLVEMHGGRVEVSSEGQGQGSEFVVRLPGRLHARPERLPAASENSAASLDGLKVLVVDDNHDAADTLRMLLALLEADAHVAYNGNGALEALESFDADVVLLDIGMPDLDGYAVARRIREGPCHGKPFLVAVTGRGQEQDRMRSIAEGFDHHLSKPTDFNTLLELLCTLKGRRAGPVAMENSAQ